MKLFALPKIFKEKVVTINAFKYLITYNITEDSFTPNLGIIVLNIPSTLDILFYFMVFLIVCKRMLSFQRLCLIDTNKD